MKYILAIFYSIILTGCAGSSVMKARRISILDEYFIMGKTKYKIYINAIAHLQSKKGHYIISRDTIYLLGTKKKDTYSLFGYAFPDTSSGTVLFKKVDTTYTQTYEMKYYRPRH